MHFIRYKIISDKPKSLTLNNEAVVQTPVTLRWPCNNAFFIDNIKIDPVEIEKVQSVTVYKITNDEFIIKLNASKSEAVIEHENKNFKIVNTGSERGVIFGDGFYVADEIDLKGNTCTITKNLNTSLNHHRIIVFSDKIEQDYIATKGKPNVTSTSLAFLQCIKVNDYVNAQKLTNIKLSPVHLKEFFGNFEVIDANTIAHPTINPNFFITQKLGFTIEHGVIIDIR